MTTVGFEFHDHDSCVADAMARAERRCADEKLRLTPLRRRVLEILLSEHRAMGAYDILEKLRREGLGREPPIAYRALNFLVSHGFAHKVERLNAFAACTMSGAAHEPAFLICRACGSVAETEAKAATAQLGKTAAEAGFSPENAVCEIEGLCPRCHEPAAP